jgi:hypothetical protein
MRTLIFGAGSDCARLLRRGLPGEEIVGLIDNDAAKRGSIVHGYRVFGANDLMDLRYDRIRIASSATMPIYRQLRELGIPDERLCTPLLEPMNRRRLESLRAAHVGRPAVIVGNGPSLRLEDLDAIHRSGMVSFAFNKIYLAYDRTPFRPTYYLVEDFLVAENNAAAINALRGTPKLFPDILLRWVEVDTDTILYGMTFRGPEHGPPGFSEDPLDFHWGATVAYSALQWAAYMGCDPVYLVGVDFTFTLAASADQQVHVAGPAERNHFLPEYRKPGERWNKPMLEFNREAFEVAREHAEQQDRRIYNATRGGVLDVFPRVDLEAVVASQTRP